MFCRVNHMLIDSGVKKKDTKYAMIWDSNTDEISAEVTIIKPNTLGSKYIFQK